MIARPTDEQPAYGRSLTDPGYWAPWVREALSRHGLASGELETPFPGSFPTFLVGDLVVKLFGEAFDGRRSSEVEVDMHLLLSHHPDIPAPAMVASGHLYEEPPTWPYVVTERLPGRAVREARPLPAAAREVAADVGAAVGRLHGLTPPDALRRRDLVPQLRHEAPARLRRFGLPEHLIEQVPPFLADCEPASVLVHGDITADHVFVADGSFVAIIDWGDAVVADRSYELPAVYLDAFDCDRELLGVFLDPAGWARDDTFARRGLQGVLEFQFNAVTRVATLVDLDAVRTLEELSERLFLVQDT